MKKTKLNNVKNRVHGKFFTIERKLRKGNENRKYCAKFVSESPHYITINDIHSGKNVKMNKTTVTSIKCGKCVIR